MKKSILALFFILIATNLFAQSVKLKKNEVIVVLKVDVVSDIDRDFIETTRGITDTSNPDVYKIKSYDGGRGSWQNNDFSISFYEKDKTNPIKIRGFEYYLFNSTFAEIYIPLEFSFTIPADAKAVYIGSFEIYIDGRTFEIKSIKRFDEYDDAQKVLDQRYPETHFDLVRIEELMVSD